MEDKKTIMLVLGSGGHTKQMIILANMLGRDYNYEYVIAKDDLLSEKKIKIPGGVFRLYNPRKMTDKSRIITFFKAIISSFESISLLAKSKADIIIACGPGLAIPLSIIGKLFFRKKLIFIESWSRVYSKSLAGKFLYPISDISFVQWEQELENYPAAVFAGRFG